MSQRKGGMKNIGESLGKLRLPSNVKAHIENSALWTQWTKIVGPELSRVTSPHELRGKTLLIEVAHQAWAQQLHFLKPSLLAKIRQYSKSASVTQLEFRVSKQSFQPRWEEEKEVVPEKESEPAPLTERQELTLKAVEDEDLRNRIRQAMQAAANRSRHLASSTLD